MSEEQNLERGPDGSPPGHIEKMLGKSADAPADAPEGGEQVAERPENIPEKFWDAEKGEVNVEALLKSQQDGEAALRGQQETPEETAETPEETPAAADQQNVVNAASAEWAEKGELTDDTFKKLESVGLSRDMVETYIAGQQAIISNLQSAAYKPFDGQEGYDAAANWAAENLSESEIRALDVQLTSTNPDIVAEGAKALAKRFQAEGNIEPSAIRGGNNTPTSGNAYRSRAEMIRDMSSARYRTDAGFRQEVMEKLSRSNL